MLQPWLWRLRCWLLAIGRLRLLTGRWRCRRLLAWRRRRAWLRRLSGGARLLGLRCAWLLCSRLLAWRCWRARCTGWLCG